MHRSKSVLALLVLLAAAIVPSLGWCEAERPAGAEDAARPRAAAAERAEAATPSREGVQRAPVRERPAPEGPEPTYAGVVYGSASGQDLLLDVYLAESSEPTPVMVFIHGGGWQGGSRKMRTSFPLDELLPAGISVVSIDYRLLDVAIHPAQVEDSTRAVQFVRHKAKEWKLDPKRVGVMGSSAGAHLALMVGLRDDAAKAGAEDPVEGESSRVSCIVSLAGPTDFNLLKKMEHQHPAYRRVLGFEPGTPAEEMPQELLDDISPMTYVSAGDPPAMLVHGTADKTVPIEHAIELDKKLREAGVESRFVKLEGEGHGVGIGKAQSPARLKSVEFVKKYLLGERKTGAGSGEKEAEG